MSVSSRSNGLENGLTVDTLYQMVMDDVVNGVREAFLDDGIDESVLQELKMLWHMRLGDDEDSVSSPNTSSVLEPPSEASLGPLDPDELVPVQVSLPVLPTDPVGLKRSITIHVPVHTIHTNKLQEILSIPRVQATLNLPSTDAAVQLQREVDKLVPRSKNLQKDQNVDGVTNGTKSSKKTSSSAKATQSIEQSKKPTTGLNSRSRSTSKSVPEAASKPAPKSVTKSAPNSTTKVASKSVTKTESIPTRKSARLTRSGSGMLSLDGAGDEDESDDSSDDDFMDVIEETEEPKISETITEQVNTDDGDQEMIDLVDLVGADAEPERGKNMIVCQYDKITRTRNKWKFLLKDGILNLEGKDYIFQKANGDAEW